VNNHTCLLNYRRARGRNIKRKKTRKLVFFDFVTNFGGAQRSTTLLCKQLQKTNNVEVIDAYGICEQYLSAMEKQNIPVHVLIPDAKHMYIGHKGNALLRTASLLRQLPEFFKLRKTLMGKISELKPDVIWVNSGKALAFLAYHPFFRKLPVALYARGWYQKRQYPFINRFLIKNFTDGILALSNPTKQALTEWPIPADKIHMVLNTIDFENIFAQRDEGLSDMPPAADRSFKILSPAGLLRTKGQHTAIRAAASLKQQGLNFVMWLAGDVGIGDKSGYRDYLKGLITENGLDDTVFLLGWRSDVPSLINLSDAVILPTHTEGLPRVVFESMILKRPVITTPAGGIPDLIEDGQTGLLFAVDDDKQLAANIEKLMKDRELYRQLVQKAHKHIYENFNTERHVEMVQQAFENIITSKERKKKHDETIE